VKLSNFKFSLNTVSAQHYGNFRQTLVYRGSLDFCVTIVVLSTCRPIRCRTATINLCLCSFFIRPLFSETSRRSSVLWTFVALVLLSSACLILGPSAIFSGTQNP